MATKATAARDRPGVPGDGALDAVLANGLAVLRDGAAGASTVPRAMKLTDEQAARLGELVALLRVLLDQLDAARQPEDTIEHRVLRALRDFERGGTPLSRD